MSKDKLFLLIYFLTRLASIPSGYEKRRSRKIIENQIADVFRVAEMRKSIKIGRTSARMCLNGRTAMPRVIQPSLRFHSLFEKFWQSFDKNYSCCIRKWLKLAKTLHGHKHSGKRTDITLPKVTSGNFLSYFKSLFVTRHHSQFSFLQTCQRLK